jgi:hypothetical protein
LPLSLSWARLSVLPEAAGCCSDRTLKDGLNAVVGRLNW